MPKLPPRWQESGSKPSSVRALLRRGLDLHRRGALAEALNQYELVLRLDPRNPDALNLLGVLKLDQGDAEAATSLLQRAVAASPKSSAMQSNLGNALRAVGRTADAVDRYTLAIRLDPQHAAAHYNLGQALRGLARFDEAVPSLLQAQELAPQDLWAQALAEALMQLGNLRGAEDVLKAQLGRSPNWATGYSLQGGVRVLQGRVDEGMALLDCAIGLEPLQARHLGTKGAWLLKARRIEEAEYVLRAALTIDASVAQTSNDLGRALRAQGDMAEARAAFVQAISLDAAHADARRNLALIEQVHAPSRLEEIRVLLRSGKLSSDDQSLLEFAAGKLLDDVGEFGEAFNHYRRGNALQLKTRRQDLEQGELYAIKRAETAITSATSLPSAVGSNDETPVFVVGMPRSGTSLVEQIVATHSQGFGAGELSWILDFSQGLWEEEGIEAAANRYVREIKALAPEALRVTDKLPSNLLYLDVVSELFHQPRVIICRRQPLDTILSCYFQTFSHGNEFSYDLRACARRWILKDRLANAYIRSPRIRGHEIRYESLVNDVEGEARKLIGFLDLPWEAACLQFHQTRRTVVTASGWQVRQPVYLKSVGRWRGYEAQLRDALGAELFDELLEASA